jgi:hypothetical protein
MLALGTGNTLKIKFFSGSGTSARVQYQKFFESMLSTDKLLLDKFVGGLNLNIGTVVFSSRIKASIRPFSVYLQTKTSASGMTVLVDHSGQICTVYIYGGSVFVRTYRILGRNWDKSLKRFPPCYSHSPLLTDFTPPL